MNRSSKVITLALVGSALVLGGFCCVNFMDTNPNSTFGSRRYGGTGGGSHFIYTGGSSGRSIGSGGGTNPSGGGGVSAGPGRTGGFGGIGHAAAGS